MSVSTMSASPLQSITSGHSMPTSNPAGRSSDVARPVSDTASISPQAVQLNTSSTLPINTITATGPQPTTSIAPLTTNSRVQTADMVQAGNVSGCHQHYHSHRYGGHGLRQEQGSFIDRLAQSIVTDLHQALGMNTDTTTPVATTPPVVAQPIEGSLLDKLARAIAKELLAQYQGPISQTSKVPSLPGQVNAVA